MYYDHIKNNQKLSHEFLFKKHLDLFFTKINIFKEIFEIKKTSHKINIPLDLLLDFSPLLAQKFLKKPYICFSITEEYLNELYSKIKNNKKDSKKLRLNFTFNLKKKIVHKFTCPRFLRNRSIGEIIFIEGTVISCSEKRVKLKQTVYFCQESEKIYIKKTNRNQDQFTYFNNVKDIYGNNLELEYGLSKFVDWQNVCIQDFPESVPVGQIPRKVTVILEDDLVNSCSIGHKVKICGIYQPLSFSNKKSNMHLFSCGVKCLSLFSNLKSCLPKSLKCDIILMKNFSLLIDSFSRLASLVAPRIFGQTLVKKGIILFLVGKTSKINKKIFSKRQMINVLLIGDSCVLKTHFLRFVENFSSEVVFTTLKNSCPTELGINILSEHKLGVNIIKPGPLVLADNGVICIDELENISDFDKIILCEVLEHQIISVPNFEYPSVLNARCGILAAATSIFGIYNRKRSVQTNVNLPSKIISEFDLVFLIQDNSTPQEDARFANYLIDDNRYIKKKCLDTKKRNEQRKEKLFPLKYLRAEDFSVDFLRIFINFSKTILLPKLANEAVDYILNDYKRVKFFVEKKKQTKIKYIESVIRLTVNYTKLHFRSVGTMKDAMIINNYLTMISKNNRGEVIDKNGSNDKYYTKSNDVHVPIAKKFLSANTENSDSYEKFNNIQIHQKYFNAKKFNFIKNSRFSFSKAKKFLADKYKYSCFERTISEWLGNEMCLIFKKNLIIL
nr:minichromosome maintenance complex component 3-like protein [Cryptomonas sp.]